MTLCERPILKIQHLLSKLYDNFKEFVKEFIVDQDAKIENKFKITTDLVTPYQIESIKTGLTRQANLFI